jgi:hypothetical protein
MYNYVMKTCFTIDLCHARPAFFKSNSVFSVWSNIREVKCFDIQVLEVVKHYLFLLLGTYGCCVLSYRDLDGSARFIKMKICTAAAAIHEANAYAES